MPAAPIDVGDAVLNFVADTTQLDSAYAKLELVPAKLQPPKVAIQDLSNTVQGLGTYFGQAGTEAIVAGEEMAQAGTKADFSMREAKGTAALLGEEIGVRMPRHVQSFVASLPGVGKAMESAFSAVAVIALIEVIIEGTKKLTEFIADHFIFTEALKAVEKEVAALNVVLLEQKKAYDEAHEALRVWGFTAQETADDAVTKLTTAINKNEEELRNNLNTLYFYRNGLGGTADDAKKAGDKVQELTATIKAQNEQLTLAQIIQQKVAFDNYVKHQDELIAVAKEKGTFRAQQELLAEQLKLSALKINYTQETQAKTDLEEKLYQLDLQAMRSRLILLQQDGKNTVQQQVQVNLQIEELEHAHTLKLEQNYLDFKNKLHDLRLNDIPLLTSPIPAEVHDKVLDDFNQIKDAADQVGINLSQTFFKSAQDAGYAYNLLKASGTASLGDLLRAQIALIQATKEYKQDLGESTKQEDKSLNELNDKYDKLRGTVDKTHKQTHDFFQQWQLDMKHGVDGMESIKEIGKQSFNQLAQGIESAVASAILAQGNLGQALEQATAQALASLAAQALVKALFYTAEGFAALAGFSEYSASQYFAAAGEMALVGGAAAVAGRALSGGSANNPGGASSSGAAGSAPVISAPTPPQPVQTQNIQHFATGGLVTGPTLAKIGDSNRNGGRQEEAAIPLDDPQAVKKIVAALGGGGGPQIHIHVKGMISPDNLKKVVKDINRKVNKGQVNLVSSNSLRVTKRSN